MIQLNKQTKQKKKERKKKPPEEGTSNPRYLNLLGAIRLELGSKVRNQPANSRKLNEEWNHPHYANKS